MNEKDIKIGDDIVVNIEDQIGDPVVIGEVVEIIEDEDLITFTTAFTVDKLNIIRVMKND